MQCLLSCDRNLVLPASGSRRTRHGRRPETATCWSSSGITCSTRWRKQARPGSTSAILFPVSTKSVASFQFSASNVFPWEPLSKKKKKKIVFSLRFAHRWPWSAPPAGRRCSWEDQPGVAGREECPGRHLLGPQAVLWQYLPGAAVRGFRLSVAPPLGPGVGLPRPGAHLHYRRRAGLWRRQQHGDGSGAELREPQSHTLTLLHRKSLFPKVYSSFFKFSSTLQLKILKKQTNKKDKRGSCDLQVRRFF